MKRIWLSLLFLGGCAVVPPTPTPPPAPSTALHKLSHDQWPLFEDDFDTTSLRTAALHSLSYYRSRPPEERYTLASDSYTATEMVASMEAFVQLLDQGLSIEARQEALKKDFNVYQSAGTDAKKTVTFSSYYEPTIPARLKRTETFRYPIYGRPPDLLDIDLGDFDPAYAGARIAGRQKGQNVVPYYTREQIDTHKVLRSKVPILAWAKTPVDIFFMQVEGSGWLDLGRGEKLRIRYAGNNGHKYKSVGQYMIATGRLPKEQFSHNSFEAYLNKNTKERQALLNFNPRYVFFHIDRSSASAFAHGNIQVPLTARRSIATDPKIFPKGGLAWIATDHPVLDKNGDATGRSESLKRFMLNQDEGGAIQGPGRVDFFAGAGIDAHNFATHFWQKGTLYFLVKKKS